MGAVPARVSYAVPVHYAAEIFAVAERDVQREVSASPSAYVQNDQLILLAVGNKMPNYLRQCTGFLTDAQKPFDPIGVIRKYTSETGGFCYRINIGLATDHQQILQSEGMYIRHLKYCIGKMGFKPNVLLRGVDMEPSEVQRMEQLGIFYIPSFTSTSDRGGHFQGKNTILHIDARAASWALKIEPAWTDYPTESEVLLSCYTKFQFLGKEENGQCRTIYLKILQQLQQ